MSAGLWLPWWVPATGVILLGLGAGLLAGLILAARSGRYRR